MAGSRFDEILVQLKKLKQGIVEGEDKKPKERRGD